MEVFMKRMIGLMMMAAACVGGCTTPGDVTQLVSDSATILQILQSIGAI
jgi:hypothetical protein